MASRGTARDQLQRILYLLPAAGGDGAEIGELAEALDVSADVVVGDLLEVTAREYYHRAGMADQLIVLMDSDRVRVRTAGDFRRPTALGPREALALSMGIRVLAGDRDEEARVGLLELAGRLETDLASVRIEDFRPSFAIEGDAAGAADSIRGTLSDAVESRRVVTFRYLKSGAQGPAASGSTGRPPLGNALETRTLEPYALVGSMGHWYAIGYDRDRAGLRVFRTDRMLDLEVHDEGFQSPGGEEATRSGSEDFDLDDYLSGGRVYLGHADVRATVRYAPSIARWILEREDGVEAPDGSATVEHVVGDPRWAVRLVLGYGGEAELVAPPELRANVAASARAIVEAHSD